MDRQLPTLDPGVTLLEATEAPSALYRLVGRHLADADGPAYWLDARNAAAPAAIREHATGSAPRTLRVARAFTGYQHYELVRELPGRAAPDAALVVAPNLGALYAEDDVPDYEADAMVDVACSLLGAIGDAAGVPVLVTAPDPTYRDRVEGGADRTLTAERTRAGLRVEGPAFRTQVYWDDWGYQTTIPYWARRRRRTRRPGSRPRRSRRCWGSEMGRTRRTLRDQFDALEREWAPFRRSLRRLHQPAFDRLFDRARSHADAAGQQNAPDTWRAFVFSVLLAQERALAAQEEEIEGLRRELAALRAEIAERDGEVTAAGSDEPGEH